MVTYENDVLEAVQLEATCGKLDQLHKVLAGKCDRAWEAHVTGRGIEISLRNVSNHRRHQCISKPTRDLFRCIFDDEIVLADDHLRSVLLGSANRQDQRRLSCTDRVPKLRPRKLF